MGQWAYLFIDLNKDVRSYDCRSILNQIDGIREVENVDLVDGKHDMVATVEVPYSLEGVMEQIKSFEGVRSVNACKIVGRRKEW